jgi:hypothetical protein
MSAAANAGVAQGRAGGADGEIGQTLALGQRAALARAGPGLDPGLVDAEVAGDLGVRDDGVRDGVPGTGEESADARGGAGRSCFAACGAIGIYAGAPRPRSAAARSARTNFCTLPDAVSGSSAASTRIMCAGTL